MKRRQHGQNVIMMRMSGGGSSCSHCDPDIYVHKLALDKELVQMLLYTTIQAKTYNIQARTLPFLPSSPCPNLSPVKILIRVSKQMSQTNVTTILLANAIYNTANLARHMRVLRGSVMACRYCTSIALYVMDIDFQLMRGHVHHWSSSDICMTSIYTPNGLSGQFSLLPSVAMATG